MNNLSIWKIFGVFSTILIISLFLGSTIIGIIRGAGDGDWGEVLKNSGGKIFAIDKNLNDISDKLITLTENNAESYEISYNLIYGFVLLFILFVICVMLFKFGSWLFGRASLDPLTDIFLIALIIGIFFTLEFLYTLIILDSKVLPLQGVGKFILTLPKVFSNILY